MKKLFQASKIIITSHFGVCINRDKCKFTDNHNWVKSWLFDKVKNLQFFLLKPKIYILILIYSNPSIKFTN